MSNEAYHLPHTTYHLSLSSTTYPLPITIWKLRLTIFHFSLEFSIIYHFDLLLMFLSGNLLASRKDYWFFLKNSALNLGTIFFYKDAFIYHINLEELKNKIWLRFLCVFKDMFVERSKNILKICPNLLHF